MFEKFVSNALESVLADYCEGVDVSKLRLSLFSGGTVELKDVKLKQSLLAGLALPVSLHAAVCKSIKVSIPLRAFISKPVVVTVDGVYVTITSPMDKTWDRKAQNEIQTHLKEGIISAFEAKRKQAIAADDEARKASSTDAPDVNDNGSNERTQAPKAEEEEDMGGLLKFSDQSTNFAAGTAINLVERIASNVQVSVTNIHVRYESVCRGIIVGAMIESVAIETTDSTGKSTFANPKKMEKMIKTLKISGVQAYVEPQEAQSLKAAKWNHTTNSAFYSLETDLSVWAQKMKNRVPKSSKTPAADDGSSSSQNLPALSRSTVVGPIDLSLLLQLMYKNHAAKNLTTPYVSLDAGIDNAMITLTRPQLLCVLEFGAQLTNWSLMAPFYRFRSADLAPSAIANFKRHSEAKQTSLIPASTPAKREPNLMAKKYWNFAIRAVLFLVKQPRIDKINQRVSMYFIRDYSDLFGKAQISNVITKSPSFMKAEPQLTTKYVMSSDEERRLKSLERTMSSRDIIRARKRAYKHVRGAMNEIADKVKGMKATAESSDKKRWFGNWRKASGDAKSEEAMLKELAEEFGVGVDEDDTPDAKNKGKDKDSAKKEPKEGLIPFTKAEGQTLNPDDLPISYEWVRLSLNISTVGVKLNLPPNPTTYSTLPNTTTDIALQPTANSPTSSSDVSDSDSQSATPGALTLLLKDLSVDACVFNSPNKDSLSFALGLRDILLQNPYFRKTSDVAASTPNPGPRPLLSSAIPLLIFRPFPRKTNNQGPRNPDPTSTNFFTLRGAFRPIDMLPTIPSSNNDEGSDKDKHAVIDLDVNVAVNPIVIIADASFVKQLMVFAEIPSSIDVTSLRDQAKLVVANAKSAAATEVRLLAAARNVRSPGSGMSPLNQTLIARSISILSQSPQKSVKSASPRATNLSTKLPGPSIVGDSVVAPYNPNASSKSPAVDPANRTGTVITSAASNADQWGSGSNYRGLATPLDNRELGNSPPPMKLFTPTNGSSMASPSMLPTPKAITSPSNMSHSHFESQIRLSESLRLGASNQSIFSHDGSNAAAAGQQSGKDEESTGPFVIVATVKVRMPIVIVPQHTFSSNGSAQQAASLPALALTLDALSVNFGGNAADAVSIRNAKPTSEEISESEKRTNTSASLTKLSVVVGDLAHLILDPRDGFDIISDVTLDASALLPPALLGGGAVSGPLLASVAKKKDETQPQPPSATPVKSPSDLKNNAASSQPQTPQSIKVLADAKVVSLQLSPFAVYILMVLARQWMATAAAFVPASAPTEAPSPLGKEKGADASDGVAALKKVKSPELATFSPINVAAGGSKKAATPPTSRPPSTASATHDPLSMSLAAQRSRSYAKEVRDAERSGREYERDDDEIEEDDRARVADLMKQQVRAAATSPALSPGRPPLPTKSTASGLKPASTQVYTKIDAGFLIQQLSIAFCNNILSTSSDSNDQVLASGSAAFIPPSSELGSLKPTNKPIDFAHYPVLDISNPQLLGAAPSASPTPSLHPLVKYCPQFTLSLTPVQLRAVIKSNNEIQASAELLSLAIKTDNSSIISGDAGIFVDAKVPSNESDKPSSLPVAPISITASILPTINLHLNSAFVELVEVAMDITNVVMTGAGKLAMPQSATEVTTNDESPKPSAPTSAAVTTTKVRTTMAISAAVAGCRILFYDNTRFTLIEPPLMRAPSDAKKSQVDRDFLFSTFFVKNIECNVTQKLHSTYSSVTPSAFQLPPRIPAAIVSPSSSQSKSPRPPSHQPITSASAAPIHTASSMVVEASIEDIGMRTKDLSMAPMYRRIISTSSALRQPVPITTSDEKAQSGSHTLTISASNTELSKTNQKLSASSATKAPKFITFKFEQKPAMPQAVNNKSIAIAEPDTIVTARVQPLFIVLDMPTVMGLVNWGTTGVLKPLSLLGGRKDMLVAESDEDESMNADNDKKSNEAPPQQQVDAPTPASSIMAFDVLVASPSIIIPIDARSGSIVKQRVPSPMNKEVDSAQELPEKSSSKKMESVSSPKKVAPEADGEVSDNSPRESSPAISEDEDDDGFESDVEDNEIEELNIHNDNGVHADHFLLLLDDVKISGSTAPSAASNNKEGIIAEVNNFRMLDCRSQHYVDAVRNEAIQEAKAAEEKARLAKEKVEKRRRALRIANSRAPELLSPSPRADEHHHKNLLDVNPRSPHNNSYDKQSDSMFSPRRNSASDKSVSPINDLPREFTVIPPFSIKATVSQPPLTLDAATTKNKDASHTVEDEHPAAAEVKVEFLSDQDVSIGIKITNAVMTRLLTMLGKNAMKAASNGTNYSKVTKQKDEEKKSSLPNEKGSTKKTAGRKESRPPVAATKTPSTPTPKSATITPSHGKQPLSPSRSAVAAPAAAVAPPPIITSDISCVCLMFMSDEGHSKFMLNINDLFFKMQGQKQKLSWERIVMLDTRALLSKVDVAKSGGGDFPLVSTESSQWDPETRKNDNSRSSAPNTPSKWASQGKMDSSTMAASGRKDLNATTMNKSQQKPLSASKATTNQTTEQSTRKDSTPQKTATKATIASSDPANAPKAQNYLFVCGPSAITIRSRTVDYTKEGIEEDVHYREEGAPLTKKQIIAQAEGEVAPPPSESGAAAEVPDVASPAATKGQNQGNRGPVAGISSLVKYLDNRHSPNTNPNAITKDDLAKSQKSKSGMMAKSEKYEAKDGSKEDGKSNGKSPQSGFVYDEPELKEIFPTLAERDQQNPEHISESATQKSIIDLSIDFELRRFALSEAWVSVADFVFNEKNQSALAPLMAKNPNPGPPNPNDSEMRIHVFARQVSVALMASAATKPENMFTKNSTAAPAASPSSLKKKPEDDKLIQKSESEELAEAKDQSDEEEVFVAQFGDLHLLLGLLSGGCKPTEQPCAVAAIYVSLATMRFTHMLTGKDIVYYEATEASAETQEVDEKKTAHAASPTTASLSNKTPLPLLEVSVINSADANHILLHMREMKAYVSMPILNQLIFYSTDSSQPVTKLMQIGAVQDSADMAAELVVEEAKKGKLLLDLTWASPEIIIPCDARGDADIIFGRSRKPSNLAKEGDKKNKETDMGGKRNFYPQINPSTKAPYMNSTVVVRLGDLSTFVRLDNTPTLIQPLTLTKKDTTIGKMLSEPAKISKKGWDALETTQRSDEKDVDADEDEDTPKKAAASPDDNVSASDSDIEEVENDSSYTMPKVKGTHSTIVVAVKLDKIRISNLLEETFITIDVKNTIYTAVGQDAERMLVFADRKLWVPGPTVAVDVTLHPAIVNASHHSVIEQTNMIYYNLMLVDESKDNLLVQREKEKDQESEAQERWLIEQTIQRLRKLESRQSQALVKEKDSADNKKESGANNGPAITLEAPKDDDEKTPAPLHNNLRRKELAIADEIALLLAEIGAESEPNGETDSSASEKSPNEDNFKSPNTVMDGTNPPHSGDYSNNAADQPATAAGFAALQLPSPMPALPMLLSVKFECPMMAVELYDANSLRFATLKVAEISAKVGGNGTEEEADNILIIVGQLEGHDYVTNRKIMFTDDLDDVPTLKLENSRKMVNSESEEDDVLTTMKIHVSAIRCVCVPKILGAMIDIAMAPISGAKPPQPDPEMVKRQKKDAEEAKRKYEWQLQQASNKARKQLSNKARELEDKEDPFIKKKPRTLLDLSVERFGLDFVRCGAKSIPEGSEEEQVNKDQADKVSSNNDEKESVVKARQPKSSLDKIASHQYSIVDSEVAEKAKSLEGKAEDRKSAPRQRTRDLDIIAALEIDFVAVKMESGVWTKVSEVLGKPSKTDTIVEKIDVKTTLSPDDAVSQYTPYKEDRRRCTTIEVIVGKINIFNMSFDVNEKDKLEVGGQEKSSGLKYPNENQTKKVNERLTMILRQHQKKQDKKKKQQLQTPTNGNNTEEGVAASSKNVDDHEPTVINFVEVTMKTIDENEDEVQEQKKIKDAEEQKKVRREAGEELRKKQLRTLARLQEQYPIQERWSPKDMPNLFGLSSNGDDESSEESRESPAVHFDTNMPITQSPQHAEVGREIESVTKPFYFINSMLEVHMGAVDLVIVPSLLAEFVGIASETGNGISNAQKASRRISQEASAYMKTPEKEKNTDKAEGDKDSGSDKPTLNLDYILESSETAENGSNVAHTNDQQPTEPRPSPYLQRMRVVIENPAVLIAPSVYHVSPMEIYPGSLLIESNLLEGAHGPSLSSGEKLLVSPSGELVLSSHPYAQVLSLRLAVDELDLKMLQRSSLRQDAPITIRMDSIKRHPAVVDYLKKETANAEKRRDSRKSDQKRAKANNDQQGSDEALSPARPLLLRHLSTAENVKDMVTKKAHRHKEVLLERLQEQRGNDNMSNLNNKKSSVSPVTTTTKLMTLKDNGPQPDKQVYDTEIDVAVPNLNITFTEPQYLFFLKSGGEFMTTQATLTKRLLQQKEEAMKLAKELVEEEGSGNLQDIKDVDAAVEHLTEEVEKGELDPQTAHIAKTNMLNEKGKRDKNSSKSTTAEKAELIVDKKKPKTEADDSRKELVIPTDQVRTTVTMKSVTIKIMSLFDVFVNDLSLDMTALAGNVSTMNIELQRVLMVHYIWNHVDPAVQTLITSRLKGVSRAPGGSPAIRLGDQQSPASSTNVEGGSGRPQSSREHWEVLAMKQPFVPVLNAKGISVHALAPRVETDDCLVTDMSINMESAECAITAKTLSDMMKRLWEPMCKHLLKMSVEPVPAIHLQHKHSVKLEKPLTLTSTSYIRASGEDLCQFELDLGGHTLTLTAATVPTPQIVLGENVHLTLRNGTIVVPGTAA